MERKNEYQSESPKKEKKNSNKIKENQVRVFEKINKTDKSLVRKTKKNKMIQINQKSGMNE